MVIHVSRELINIAQNTKLLHSRAAHAPVAGLKTTGFSQVIVQVSCEQPRDSTIRLITYLSLSLSINSFVALKMTHAFTYKIKSPGQLS
jgi:hypothetical protein